MKSTTHITLDTQKTDKLLRIIAKQGDQGSRYLSVRVTSNGSAFPVTTDMQARMRCVRRDGVPLSTDATILEDGTIEVQIPDALMELAGMALADITLFDQEGTFLSTMVFSVFVKDAPLGSAEDPDPADVNALTTALARLDGVIVQVEQVKRLLDNLPQDFQDVVLDVADVKESVANLQDDFGQFRNSVIAQMQNNKARSLDYVDGYYIYDDGNISAIDNWCYTQPLMIAPASRLIIKGNFMKFIIFYDKSMEYITGTHTDANYSGITPSNACYIRVAIEIANKGDLVINTTDNIFSGFQNDILTGGWKRGYYLYCETGIESPLNGWSYTPNYALCGGGNTYLVPPFSNSVHICFYDENKNFIGGTTDVVFTTPKNAAYLRLSTISDHEDYMYLTRAEHFTVMLGSDYMTQYTDIVKALKVAGKLKKPLYIYGGEYDISGTGGTGLSVYTDIIGIGNPQIIAELPEANNDFSILNFDLTAGNNVKVSGLHLVARNCRYAIHCEMGGNKATPVNKAHYTHRIENCTIEMLDDRRAIGCGLGDNGLLIIDGCYIKVNGGYGVAIHTGYDGQRKPAKAMVTNCVVEGGTLQAESINTGDSGYVDTIIYSNNLLSSEVEVLSSNTNNLKVIQFQNTISG